MYARKKSSKEDIAVIKGSITYLFFVIINIYIRAIDGVEQRLLTSNKVEVRPGPHRVAIEYILITYSVKISTNVDLLINFEAGHEYKFKGNSSCLVVMDTTSGGVVASYPLKQYTTFSLYSM